MEGPGGKLKLYLEGTKKPWKSFNDISLPLVSQPIIYLGRPSSLQVQTCCADWYSFRLKHTDSLAETMLSSTEWKEYEFWIRMLGSV